MTSESDSESSEKISWSSKLQEFTEMTETVMTIDRNVDLNCIDSDVDISLMSENSVDSQINSVNDYSPTPSFGSPSMSLNCSMSSIPSLVSPESEYSLDYIQMDSSEIDSMISSPQPKDNSIDKISQNGEEVCNQLKGTDLRRLVSPHFDVNEFMAKYCHQKKDIFSDHSVPENKKKRSNVQLIPEDMVCCYFEDNNPGKDSNQSNDWSSEKSAITLKTPEKSEESLDSPKITESTQSGDLESIINDIYFDMSSEKRGKIVSDLNESTTSPQNRESVEDLINTVYSDYTDGQKKEILEGLNDPNQRQLNKDIDNIMALIESFNLSNESKSSLSSDSSKHSKKSNYGSEEELEKMFKQSIFSSDSSQNNIEEKKSDKRTKRGSQKSNESKPLEAKWKQAEDPKEPRPARRSR